jgi:hypothetical protein
MGGMSLKERKAKPQIVAFVKIPKLPQIQKGLA